MLCIVYSVSCTVALSACSWLCRCPRLHTLAVDVHPWLAQLAAGTPALRRLQLRVQPPLKGVLQVLQQLPAWPALEHVRLDVQRRARQTLKSVVSEDAGGMGRGTRANPRRSVCLS